MDPERARLLRRLPAVDELLRDPRLAPYLPGLSRSQAAEVVRQVLTEARRRLLTAPRESLPPDLEAEELARQVCRALAGARTPSLRRVLNATGVIIHTNLGRSLLADSAQEAVAQAALSYSNLEYNLAEGRRGSRHDHLEAVLTSLTGAQAALVVNNNAAAVLLSLTALAAGREVIISRGQLVEIGGSFRMPDIMAASGAILREVGTTNKTYIKDYEQAITGNTALLLKVHPSNFRLLGFTREVSLEDLVALGRRYGLPVMEDLGSGCLVDLSGYGVEKEPTVQETVAAGPDLVMFSGDKLLGGPQAGIILGRAEMVQRLRQHPLTRALRPDKLTLAGLEATLLLYLDQSRAVAAIPTLAMITRPVEEVARDARRLARSLRRRCPAYSVKVVPCLGRVGGGALPQVGLLSAALALDLPPLAPHQLEARLRRASPPVIARLERDRLLLDLRTLTPRDQATLLQVLESLAASVDTWEGRG
ncbi:MAG: L-seryl-tRNA(Sec) selenium transferase [Deltaproteobacteria bacterium]|nr:L-seryl-tRNA(Sec) selenium transferase [Deltaproteobacteria bacterium]